MKMKTKILDPLCKTFSLRDADTMGQPCVCVKNFYFRTDAHAQATSFPKTTLFFLNQKNFFFLRKNHISTKVCTFSKNMSNIKLKLYWRLFLILLFFI